MVNKKKYHGGLKVLLLLLFTMLLSMFSTCYANISSEYFDYAISTMAENCVYNSTTYQNNARTKLRNLSGDASTKTAILNNINNKLASANKSTLSDAQCIFNVSTLSSSTFTISIYFYNNTTPGGNDELTFFRVIKDNIKSNSYETGDTAYYMIVTLQYNGSWVGYTDLYTTNGNMTMNTLNASFSSTENDWYKLTIDSCACYGVPVGFAQSPLNSADNIVQVFLYDKNGNFKIPEPDPEPEEPSGESGLGNITTPSGENGGNINLQPIQQGIDDINTNLNNIENKIPTSGEIQGIISGEVGKINETITSPADINSTVISSGDITSSLGFTIAQDPYDNFWLTLTNNLKTALLGSKRSIDISFRGNTWTISLDNYLVLPAWLVIILTPITTALLVWVLVRQWKLIFDKLSSGNVDSLLKENSEEGISNLF